MPRVRVVFFRDDEGAVPVLEWLDRMPTKAQDKCRIRLERLRQMGHELRRPEADFLRDGIHELRVTLRRVNYRMLYFFHGNTAAVVSHGIIKEQAVPPIEIQRAINRKTKFESNPERHSHQELST